MDFSSCGCRREICDFLKESILVGTYTAPGRHKFEKKEVGKGNMYRVSVTVVSSLSVINAFSCESFEVGLSS